MSATLLEVEDLSVHFPVQTGGLFGKTVPLRAVDGVSFAVRPGETLSVVGESGCGKSTLGRAVLHLIPPTSGRVLYLGRAIDRGNVPRHDLQIVFQDPLASLDPRMPIGEIIAEPLKSFEPDLKGGERRERVRAIMAAVGLLPQMINRYPHEFSGGQCQRIGIARAMIAKPKLVVCDEPVSALDVSIQAQIVNLLMDLQRRLGLALLFISHDLSVVRHISTRVMVLYLGRVMEIAPRDALYEHPRHPYTKALLSAVPVPDPKIERQRERIVLKGDPPSPLDPPSGCVFRRRCPWAEAVCAEVRPPEEEVAPGHKVACVRWREVAASGT